MRVRIGIRRKVARLLRMFYRKKIVYTTKYKPAMLVKSFELGGKRYVRIAFTNRAHDHQIPMVDVEVKYVKGIRVCYSKFDKFLWKCIGVTAENRYRPVKRLKK